MEFIYEYIYITNQVYLSNNKKKYSDIQNCFYDSFLCLPRNGYGVKMLRLKKKCKLFHRNICGKRLDLDFKSRIIFYL